jgi:L-rhamnose-H+ transport protein
VIVIESISDVEIGFSLALAAGVTSGSSMLPMRLLRRWRWENVWLVFSLVALVIVPWGLALLLVPEISAIYLSLRPAQFMIPVIFGMGWGFAQILFGLTITRLGLALSYAIILGFVSVLGTIIPLPAQARSLNESNALIFVGIAVMILGIIASGWAGRLREAGLSGQSRARRSIAYGPALALAIVCGLLSPMLNYGFAFAEEIRSAAVERGASSSIAGYAVWPVVLTAGFLPNLAYSLYLLRKNQSAKLFKEGSGDAALAIVMGVVWMGSLSLYGLSAASLGDLGTSVGWGIVQALALITATVLGGLTREWAGAGRNATLLRFTGLALLIVATFLMAGGTLLNRNSLMTQNEFERW